MSVMLNIISASRYLKIYVMTTRVPPSSESKCISVGYVTATNAAQAPAVNANCDLFVYWYCFYDTNIHIASTKWLFFTT